MACRLSSAGVYVRLNRVTDKDNVAKGMMTQLPTTDIWHLTLRLPASYCGSYTMVEIPPETPDETVLQLEAVSPPCREGGPAEQHAGNKCSG